jgi:methylthioribose-1-phosphate isomerase
LTGSSFRTVEWARDGVILLDQRLLPGRERYRRLRNAESVARAIETMVVRGAPAIGVTAAMGLALGARLLRARDLASFHRGFARLCRRFAATRPTAVNLFWAIERMRRVAESNHAAAGGHARGGRGARGGAAADCPATVPVLIRRLEQEARAMHKEDVETNRRMGAHGAALVPGEATILTHCNAGALATAGYGTALGVVRAAREAGKKVRVLADETRPFLQGARLTAWELQRDRIPVRLITDSMAGHFLKEGSVDLVLVGADRIAANGDVANKIGTYPLAVLARENRVPFYVAAPLSTIDPRAKSGADIPIEQRDPAEVTSLGGRRIAPAGVQAEHPAFDVTPARLVSAIITEAGVARAPYRRALAALLRRGNMRSSGNLSVVRRRRARRAIRGASRRGPATGRR